MVGVLVVCCRNSLSPFVDMALGDIGTGVSLFYIVVLIAFPVPVCFRKIGLCANVDMQIDVTRVRSWTIGRLFSLLILTAAIRTSC